MPLRVGDEAREKSLFVFYQLFAPALQIAMVDRPVAPFRGLVRAELDSPPHVADKPVLVVDSFNRRILRVKVRAAKEDGAAPKAGLDIMLRVAKGLPYDISDG